MEPLPFTSKCYAVPLFLMGRRLTRSTRPRIAETLPEEVLAKMHAPAKPDYPIITPDQHPNFDAFIFGIPTRYGNFPGQWKVRVFRTTYGPIFAYADTSPTGVLGSDWWSLGSGCPRRQVRQHLRLYWHSRRRPRCVRRVHHYSM